MASTNISFNCPGCGREFNVDARLKGRKIRCSQCKRLSLIPSSSKARPKTMATTPPKPQVNAEEPQSAGPHSTPEPDTALADKPPEQAATPQKPRIRIVPPARKPPSSDPPATPLPDPADQDAAPEDSRETEATAAPVEHAPPTPPVHSATSEFTATPSPPASDDKAELRKQLQKVQQELAELTATREREEISYSRTIAKLSTQLHDATSQCEAITEELNTLRGEKKRQQADDGQREAEYRESVEKLRKAIDDFCNAQLRGMQTLRQTIKASLES